MTTLEPSVPSSGEASPKTIDEVCEQPPGTFQAFCKENPEAERIVLASPDPRLVAMDCVRRYGSKLSNEEILSKLAELSSSAAPEMASPEICRICGRPLSESGLEACSAPHGLPPEPEKRFVDVWRTAYDQYIAVRPLTYLAQVYAAEAVASEAIARSDKAKAKVIEECEKALILLKDNSSARNALASIASLKGK